MKLKTCKRNKIHLGPFTGDVFLRDNVGIVYYILTGRCSHLLYFSLPSVVTGGYYLPYTAGSCKMMFSVSYFVYSINYILVCLPIRHLLYRVNYVCLPITYLVYSVNYHLCLLTIMINWRKETLRYSQDSNLGPLNSGQMLLPMSYWSSGIGAEDRWHLSIDTVRFSG